MDEDADDSDGEIEEDTLIITSENEALLTKKSNELDNETLNDGTSSTAQLLSPNIKNHNPDSPYSTSSNDSTDGNRTVKYNLNIQKHSRPKARNEAKYENIFFFFDFCFLKRQFFFLLNLFLDFSYDFLVQNCG